MKKLQRIQKQALRYVYNNYSSSYEELLKSEQTNPLCATTSVSFKYCVQVFNETRADICPRSICYQ